MSDYRKQGINADGQAQVQIDKVEQNFALGVKRATAEATVLKAVDQEVAGRLAQSLHERVYIELHKHEDPQQVVRPWDLDVKEGTAPSQRCEPGTSIESIFDRRQIGGRLLVLGAPGSGKTTMLLQLARVLVVRAQADAESLIPVLLNLSAWKTDYKDIQSWMVADLKLKYGVREDVAQRWIAEKRILPLLDGLDELMSERQATCVRALNDFLTTAWVGVPLVVCSRLADYKAYKEILGLNGAVTLQPLDDIQIEQYLQAATVGWLWENIRQDPDFMNPTDGLARSPLLLTILVLASEALPPEMWQPEIGVQARQKVLFIAYVQRRLARRYYGGKNIPATKSVKKPYPHDAEVTQWLSWLATQLIEEQQTEFFIERLQPKLLKNSFQRCIYGIFIWLIYGSLILPFSEMTYWLFSGIVCISVNALISSDIQTVELIRYSREDRKKRVHYSLLPIILSIWMGTLIIPFYGFPFSYLSSIIVGSVLGFTMAVIELFTSKEITTRSKDNEGISKSLYNSVTFGAIFAFFGMFCIPVANMFNDIVPETRTMFEAVTLGASLGFFVGSTVGGLFAVVEHFSLRLCLRLFGHGPWNYSKFLRYCTERGFLQRVGGGYRFVHALLREHFAAQYGDLKIR